MIGSPMNFFDVSGANPYFQTGMALGRINSPYSTATDALRDVIRRGQQFSQSMAEQEMKKQLLGYEYNLKSSKRGQVHDLRNSLPDMKPRIDPKTGAVINPKIITTEDGVYITEDVSGEGSPVDRYFFQTLTGGGDVEVGQPDRPTLKSSDAAVMDKLDALNTLSGKFQAMGMR